LNEGRGIRTGVAEGPVEVAGDVALDALVGFGEIDANPFHHCRFV
jgi:hypothetical protein